MDINDYWTRTFKKRFIYKKKIKKSKSKGIDKISVEKTLTKKLDVTKT
jgi:hypothetical protein